MDQMTVNSMPPNRVYKSSGNRRVFGYSRRYAGMPAIRVVPSYGPSGGSGPVQAVSNYA
jgi:hypothetical protein